MSFEIIKIILTEQREEKSWCKNSKMYDLKLDWLNQHCLTFVFTYTTNLTTVTIKGPPQLNLGSSCRVGERVKILLKTDKTRQREQDKKAKLKLETVEVIDCI